MTQPCTVKLHFNIKRTACSLVVSDLSILSVPEKVPHLTNYKTKAFCLISEMLFALDK